MLFKKDGILIYIKKKAKFDIKIHYNLLTKKLCFNENLIL